MKFYGKTKISPFVSNPFLYKNFNDLGITYIKDLFLEEIGTSFEDIFNYWVNKGLSNNTNTRFKFIMLRKLALKEKKITKERFPRDINEKAIYINTGDETVDDISLFKAKSFHNLLLASRQNVYPKSAEKLKSELKVTDEELKKIYALPYKFVKIK